MRIEELVDRITPGISIGDFDSALRRLLSIILGKEEEIVAHYHHPGKLAPTDKGFTTERPETICVLTKGRIHKIDIIVEGNRQVFHTYSYLLSDIASYSVNVALMRDREGSWFAVRSFSLLFQNGEKIELHYDRETEENPLEQFTKSVLQEVAD